MILAEGNPRTAAALAAAGCEVHTYPATEIGHQRLGRADLHDPADPAWLSARRGDAGAAAVDRRRGWSRDLRALVRIPSVTGSEEAVAAWAAGALRELGLAVEVASRRIPAAIRADPDWPGEEMPRTSLPVVIGRAGPARWPADHPVGPPRRRAARRPGHLDGRSVGRRDPRRRGCTAAAPAT